MIKIKFKDLSKPLKLAAIGGLIACSIFAIDLLLILLKVFALYNSIA